MNINITLLIILANVIVSLIGFRNTQFMERYLFRTGSILKRKQYDRLLTSGFLHVNFMHLFFNMFTLFFFGSFLEKGSPLPGYMYLVIYFASLLLGNLLALVLNKNNDNYSAVGASGAVSGVLFATIALSPSTKLYLFFALGMPAWIYGVGYMLYTIYGIRSRAGNIGHEAHLGGALAGILIMVAYQPALLRMHPWVILGMTVPALVFLFIAIRYPHWLTFGFLKANSKENYTLDDRYNDRRMAEQEEIDRILDKIGKSGMQSLTDKEIRKLEEYRSRM
ncbi:MAG: rhomboid family intramembrane serine protease [Bacteroidia bacterium]|nr:rhomboid family intramembrane serine protease [Bacteroidia bacterium]